MIVINGRETDMQIGNFANLEEVLIKVMEDEIQPEHVVTDVLVNDEAFSEIYPHQAEDIESSEVRRIEVRTASIHELAADVAGELHKVTGIMDISCKKVAAMFRMGDTAEALEVLQDILDVTRHFFGTVGVLRARFPGSAEHVLEAVIKEVDALVSEMVEVLDNQDWILLADLLEFEFLPSFEGWDNVLRSIGSDIAADAG